MLQHWKDHFHPHEGNDHRPYAYRAAGAIALGLVVLTIVSFTSLQSYYITHSERFLSAVLPAVLVDLANEDRGKEGLNALEPNEKLKRAAQLKADHMAELGYFAHDAPDGTTPWEWFAQAGYEYEAAGENLAINFSDSADVERAWMDSPGHRENILEEGFTEIGIATAIGEYEGDETVFVVQLFGRPTANNLAQRDSGSTVQGESTTEPEVQPDPEREPEPTLAAAVDTEPEPEPDPEPTPEPELTPDPAPTSSNDFGEGAGPAPTSDFVEEPVDINEEAATTSEAGNALTGTTALTFATPTPIAQVQGESGIALQPFVSGVSRQASRMMHLLAQPEFLFRTLMLTLFALVALSLLISVGVEAKRHHVRQAMKSMGALAVLLIIFYLGINVIFANPDIANENYNDNRLSAVMSLSAGIPSV
ncbi:MAG: CAP domain-containing protein [Candidatus Paceibacterota bacterium]